MVKMKLQLQVIIDLQLLLTTSGGIRNVELQNKLCAYIINPNSKKSKQREKLGFQRKTNLHLEIWLRVSLFASQRLSEMI